MKTSCHCSESADYPITYVITDITPLIGNWQETKLLSLHNWPVAVSKFPWYPGPTAPNWHCSKLNGPSIEPSIHIRARRYVISALGCSFSAHEPSSSRSGHAKALPGPILGPAPGPWAWTWHLYWPAQHHKLLKAKLSFPWTLLNIQTTASY